MESFTLYKVISIRNGFYDIPCKNVACQSDTFLNNKISCFELQGEITFVDLRKVT